MIPFIRPTIPRPEKWLPYLEASYRSRRFSNFGPLSARLEQGLIEKFGNPGREAVLVGNATAGLTAGLLALDVRGRVVVPAFTFPATAHAALRANCRPLFCDVSPATWELDPLALERLLRSKKVGAVIHVRAFGFCQNLENIERLSRRYGVPLIVDAAAALGGLREDGVDVGGQGDLEVFSLHATKVFNVGEGGVVFAPPVLADKIRTVANFGLHEGDVVSAGFNAKFSEMQAAVGLAVLDMIEGCIARRRRLSAAYRKVLAPRADWHTPSRIGSPAWQTYPVLLPSENERETLIAHAGRQGVELRKYYAPALHETSFFRHEDENPLTVSSALARRMVCLPVYSDMTRREQQIVLKTLGVPGCRRGRSHGAGKAA